MRLQVSGVDWDLCSGSSGRRVALKLASRFVAQANPRLNSPLTSVSNAGFQACAALLVRWTLQSLTTECVEVKFSY